jgi:hypothetical protein
MAGAGIEGSLRHERSRMHPHPNPPPQERERECSERLATHSRLRGGWRVRQRATGGGSRHKFRYRMDPLCDPVRNDNKITEDTL